MPEWVELQRKSGQRDLLIPRYKRLEKDSDRAITPATEAVCVPAHLAPPGCPQAKQLSLLHIQTSLRQSCDRQKYSCVYACRVTSVVSNSLQRCGLWPARLLCHRDSPGRNNGVYWPILVAILFSSVQFSRSVVSDSL